MSNFVICILGKPNLLIFVLSPSEQFTKSVLHTETFAQISYFIEYHTWAPVKVNAETIVFCLY